MIQPYCFLKNTWNLYNLKLQSFIFSHPSVGLVSQTTSYELDSVLPHVPPTVLKAKGQLSHICFMPIVEVQKGDTPELLQRRVMEEAEWIILPKAIDLIAHGKVSVVNGCVEIQ